MCDLDELKRFFLGGGKAQTVFKAEETICTDTQLCDTVRYILRTALEGEQDVGDMGELFKIRVLYVRNPDTSLPWCWGNI